MAKNHKRNTNSPTGSAIPTFSYSSAKTLNAPIRYLSVFLFIALLTTSNIAYSGFVISLKEIPEWAPGHPLEIRHITIDGKGTGSVIVTKEKSNTSEVSQIALFKYEPDTIEHWADEYQKYEDSYGVDENSDKRIVEGNPETVVISFFEDGRLIKFITLSGASAYNDKSDKRLPVPEAVIALRNRLLAYAKQAEPQTKAKYYMTATPYTENQKYWLLKSTDLESIPVITDISDQKDFAFLNTLIKRAPAFLAVEEKLFLRLKKETKLSKDQFKKVFRISEESDTIVAIKFMRSTETKN